MSYILEALRKAERERNLGQTPDLQVAHRAEPMTATPSKLRRKWRLAAAIAVGLCIGFILWLRPSQSPPKAMTTVAAANPAAVTPSSPAAVAPSSPATAVPADGPAQLDDLLDPQAGNALPIAEQRKLSNAAAVPAPVPPSGPTEATPIEIPAEPEKPSMAEQAVSEPELPPEVKPLKQMAPDYRGNFPKIRIDVHVYDEDPARRFVMINGRKYHEGETIAEGPSITAIESDGVVFSYNNEEVLVPIAR